MATVVASLAYVGARLCEHQNRFEAKAATWPWTDALAWCPDRSLRRPRGVRGAVRITRTRGGAAGFRLRRCGFWAS